MFGKKKEMSDSEKKAKLAALGEANKMATGMMKGGLEGLKKVTVASDSKEGLKKGLDKAEEIVDDGGEDSNPFAKFKKDKESSPFGKSEDTSGDDSEEYEDATESMDEEELDAEIERLMQLKEKLQD